MTDLENYSDRLWKNAYERGKAETIKAVLEIIDSNLPHGVIWQEDEWQVGWHDGVTKIRNEVLALKGESE